jgi:GNAT superfamily N-acetyltransferase
MSETIETAVSGVTLRFAGPDDVPQILRFIRDLAAYEKMSDDVVANEETLRRSLFGGRRVAEVVLAEDGEAPVGFALFFHNFSTFLGRPGIYLEDLFVPPSERGRGIGRALLAFLARLTVERGCGRLEWCVLDWNEPAIGFYAKLGAKAMDEWTTFRMDGEALEGLAREG